MCGIAGVIGAEGSSVPEGIGEAFVSSMHRRGPDDYGLLRMSNGRVSVDRDLRGNPQANVLMAHCRLSIIDLTEAGWQPLGSPDGRYFIAFNGEIYNYIELREELKAKGHEFRTASDTEVLLHAFMEWGQDCLTRLIGMFAFAVLDAHERRLWLARDFFGIKPLYYTNYRGGFAFGSEMKSLVELPGISREVDPSTLFLYLRWGSTANGEATMFRDIRQLLPGHCLSLDIDEPQRLSICKYWGVTAPLKTADISFAEATERFRELFLESVHLHMRSDVPIGVALSGGVDSSSITTCARLMEPDLQLHTFSYIAKGEAICEAKWVDEVQRATNTVHHVVSIDADDIVDDLEDIIYRQDEPFGSTSIVAQYCVFKRAKREGVKVMLDGQGADEMLGGYAYHRPGRLASLLRQGKFVRAGRLYRAASSYADSPPRMLAQWTAEYLLPQHTRNLLRRCVGKDIMPDWMNADWFRERGVPIASMKPMEVTRSLKSLLANDIRRSSLPNLLRYEDRNSMAHSVESRVPFLNPVLADFVFSLPEEYLVGDDGSTKSVLRSAMRGIVPDSVLDRREKIGFRTDEADWVRSLDHWASQQLSLISPSDVPALRADAVSATWQDVVARRVKYSETVWRWINLAKWRDRFSAVVC